MAKMKELQPEMEKIKERAGDDRQKLQQEMMQLYKKEKVNPAAGCLPILLQIPIFFSLYKVIFVTIELRHAPWFGWIRDLSAPDPSSIYNFFGLLPWPAPDPRLDPRAGLHRHAAALLGVSMWLQQKLNPAPTDPTQAMIFAWLPWVFMFMLGSFASGLVIYWIANNVITFTQQYVIMRSHGYKPDVFGNILSTFRRKAARRESLPKEVSRSDRDLAPPDQGPSAARRWRPSVTLPTWRPCPSTGLGGAARCARSIPGGWAACATFCVGDRAARADGVDARLDEAGGRSDAAHPEARNRRSPDDPDRRRPRSSTGPPDLAGRPPRPAWSARHRRHGDDRRAVSLAFAPLPRHATCAVGAARPRPVPRQPLDRRVRPGQSSTWSVGTSRIGGGPRVRGPHHRCRATEANPETGSRDATRCNAAGLGPPGFRRLCRGARGAASAGRPGGAGMTGAALPARRR